jgi:hypothetical protein
MDFFAMDRHLFRGRDSHFDTSVLHGHDCYPNCVSDYDFFTHTSRQNKHDSTLLGNSKLFATTTVVPAAGDPIVQNVRLIYPLFRRRQRAVLENRTGSLLLALSRSQAVVATTFSGGQGAEKRDIPYQG